MINASGLGNINWQLVPMQICLGFLSLFLLRYLKPQETAANVHMTCRLVVLASSSSGIAANPSLRAIKETLHFQHLLSLLFTQWFVHRIPETALHVVGVQGFACTGRVWVRKQKLMKHDENISRIDSSSIIFASCRSLDRYIHSASGYCTVHRHVQCNVTVFSELNILKNGQNHTATKVTEIIFSLCGVPFLCVLTPKSVISY